MWTGVVAQGRDQWRTVVNTAMNFTFHKMQGISCLPEELLVSQDAVCYTEVTPPVNAYVQTQFFIIHYLRSITILLACDTFWPHGLRVSENRLYPVIAIQFVARWFLHLYMPQMPFWNSYSRVKSTNQTVRNVFVSNMPLYTLLVTLFISFNFN
jgi:hypothetical protein